jgi:hypothetical protein
LAQLEPLRRNPRHDEAQVAPPKNESSGDFCFGAAVPDRQLHALGR